MAKPRVKQLYFTKHDDDLYAAIQKIPSGLQNHEIRRAMRLYFLGEQPSSTYYKGGNFETVRPSVVTESVEEKEPFKENDEAVAQVKLPASLIRR
ncbi:MULTISPECIES: hypothetical protein [unclassified Paenibacillus]|uniref:hypothetical protein n=1 Tax=unclassified Paenibacillus TaxID=185978 RepID=UPI00020D6BD8|nr:MULTISPECIES: hypothetical protein [unclassified Paenibacillus]EGL17078.1 hypothetical protein HMPREF9413_2618 [Paenibacillus sp. HGF7]EPD80545.1 hypothetical protein HMPREF1207_05602 [Paenibacillus sp. HGH0039]